MKWTRKLVRFFALIMLVIMSMLIVNKALFVHVHQLSTGELVMHAHPFTKSDSSDPSKQHTHSDSEYNLIFSLGVLMLIAIFTFVIEILSRQYTFNLFKIEVKELDICISFWGRAPPAMK